MLARNSDGLCGTLPAVDGPVERERERERERARELTPSNQNKVETGGGGVRGGEGGCITC